MLRNINSEILIIKKVNYSGTTVYVPSVLHSTPHFAYKVNFPVF
jgi:hypothetical protein